MIFPQRHAIKKDYRKLSYHYTNSKKQDVESGSGRPTVLSHLYPITEMSPEIWPFWREGIWVCDEMSLPKTKDNIVSLCLTHCSGMMRESTMSLTLCQLVMPV